LVHPAIRRAFERDLKVFLGVLGVEAVLSLFVSAALRVGYLNAFHWFIVATGAVILIVSALEGSGAPEARLAESSLSTLSPSYQETVIKNRIADEQEGFWFMIVGFVWGVAFLGVAALIGLAVNP
jgi:hypothetical protein